MSRATVASRQPSEISLGALTPIAESPDLNCHQGITTDGTYFYGIDSQTIYKFDSSWNLIATNSHAASDAGISHCGDGQYHNSKLYIAAEDYSSESDNRNYRIAIYNAGDLSFIEYHDISAQGAEVSSLCINPTDNIIYVSNYTVGDKIYTYDLTTFAYRGAIVLSKSAYHAQGISYYAGKLWLSRGTPYFQLCRISLDGTVEETRTLTGYTELEGIDFSTGVLYAINDAGAKESVITYKLSARRALLYNAQASLRFRGDTIIATQYTLPASGSIFCRVNLTRLYNYNSLWDCAGDANKWECWVYSDGRIAAKTGNTSDKVGFYPLVEPVGRWLSVCLTWQNGGKSQLYIDGIHVGTDVDTTGGGSGSTFYWGGGNVGNSKGEFYMRDCRIFNQALTSDQIFSLHTSNKDPVTPVISHTMDEGSGTVVNDVTGNGYTGTITGGSWATFGPTKNRVLMSR